MYIPKPINTTDVVLPSGLLELTEKMAANSHDIWAARRIKDGWKYGPARDDTLKHNPCLVPYDELPESEKEYDRSMAIETIKLLVKLGYRITAQD